MGVRLLHGLPGNATARQGPTDALPAGYVTHQLVTGSLAQVAAQAMVPNRRGPETGWRSVNTLRHLKQRQRRLYRNRNTAVASSARITRVSWNLRAVVMSSSGTQCTPVASSS